MRSQRVLLAMVVFGVAMVSARPAAAQAGTGVAAVGFSILHDSNVEQTATGVAFDVAYNFWSSGKTDVGAVFDLGFDKFDGCWEKAFDGGGRATFRAAKARPFVQFVAGRANCGGGDGVTTLQPGFGVDVPFSPMLNFRAQIDFRNLRYTGDSVNEQRFWFGVSAKLGK
jgi:hypothetical protein